MVKSHIIHENVKNKTISNDQEPTVIDFGTRAISDQNFSKVCVLPKTALANCGFEGNMHVNVKLVQDKEGRYIKLTPVCSPEGKQEVKKENE